MPYLPTSTLALYLDKLFINLLLIDIYKLKIFSLFSNRFLEMLIEVKDHFKTKSESEEIKGPTLNSQVIPKNNFYSKNKPINSESSISMSTFKPI